MTSDQKVSDMLGTLDTRGSLVIGRAHGRAVVSAGSLFAISAGLLASVLIVRASSPEAVRWQWALGLLGAVFALFFCICVWQTTRRRDHLFLTRRGYGRTLGTRIDDAIEFTPWDRVVAFDLVRVAPRPPLRRGMPLVVATFPAWQASAYDTSLSRARSVMRAGDRRLLGAHTYVLDPLLTRDPVHLARVLEAARVRYTAAQPDPGHPHRTQPPHTGR